MAQAQLRLDNVPNLIFNKRALEDEFDPAGSTIIVLDKQGNQLHSIDGDVQGKIIIISDSDILPFCHGLTWIIVDDLNGVDQNNLNEVINNNEAYVLGGNLNLKFKNYTNGMIGALTTLNQQRWKIPKFTEGLRAIKGQLSELLIIARNMNIVIDGDFNYLQQDQKDEKHVDDGQGDIILINEKLKNIVYEAIKELQSKGLLKFKEEENILINVLDKDQDNFIKFSLIHIVNGPPGRDKVIMGITKNDIHRIDKSPVPLSYFRRFSRGLLNAFPDLFIELQGGSNLFKYFGAFWPLCEPQINIARNLINPKRPGDVSIARIMNYIESTKVEINAIKELEKTGRMNIIKDIVKQKKEFGKIVGEIGKLSNQIDKEYENEHEANEE